ncbi:MAG: peptidyl-prolyl cis-trans isomerase [Candidatus Cloacimonetes bacterium]|nr:peptidyl-prolyl cis-trans isomerase [Candidatus Cloacimonadota bacterium]
MKAIFILLSLSLLTVLLADTVASIGDYKITYEQLSEAMSLYEDSSGLSFAEIRQLCLNRLIDEQVLIIYARQNGITIDEGELDAFFIHELGDHSRFQTNGIFDYNKYNSFKQTDTGEKILKEMIRELLINKSQTLIKKSIQISEENLLQEFIIENVKLDLSYALVDVEAANVSTGFTPDKAIQFYQDNRHTFKTLKRVKFEFFLVPWDRFRREAEEYYDNLISSIYNNEDQTHDILTDSTRTAFIERETRNLTRREAVQSLNDWKANEQVSYPVLESPFLSSKDRLGSLEPDIILNAVSLNKGQYSEPLETQQGFLILRVTDVESQQYAAMDEVRDDVWQAFVTHEKNRLYSEEFRRYFSNNIDDFIIPAAIVYKILISRPRNIFSLQSEEYQSTIRTLIETNSDDEVTLEAIANDYGLSNYNTIIYLERFKNDEPVDEQIAQQIKQDRLSGFIRYDKELYFYKLSTLFPEYIPNFTDIEDEINDLIYIDQLENSEYQNYYNDNKPDFMTSDSLQVGGVIFPITADTIMVEEKLVREFYDNNINSFYRDKSVLFDYLYSTNREAVYLARNHALNGIDMALLQYCYGEDLRLESRKPISYDSLPEKFKLHLSAIPDSSCSQVFQYEQGYIFLKKWRIYEAGLPSYREVKKDILSRFQMEIADSISYNLAKTVFDSTRYYSQCLQYASKENMFTTSQLPADTYFEYLGYLNDYKDELLRMWKNEKFSRIIKLENSYAVIYLLNRTYARQLNYEEALPLIKKIFAARNRYRTAKNYVKEIRDKIIAGEDPEYLLYFLGGWHTLYNLNLKSQVFPKSFNDLIMNDIAKKEQGYCSPVISPSEDQLLFYRIDRMNKISREEFQRNRDTFLENIMAERYRKWLEQYKSQLDIKIRI